MKCKIRKYLNQTASAAPLAVFRIIFGFMMLYSIIRFWGNGWIESLYINPQFHFTYYGFSWVQPIGVYTYGIFVIAGLAALGILLGYRYKLSIILFFLSFTYIELMDKTTYLNHYYFVSLMSFIMIWLPAGDYFSLDSLRKGVEVPFIKRYNIISVQLMLSIVYFYAGLAKINSDWLINAMPLSIWLPINRDLPIVGTFLTQSWFIYLMAWSGMIYDLSIPFLLSFKKTRLIGFILVVIFHVFTRILFPIGMFPFIMIGSTMIFFSSNFHEKVIFKLRKLLHKLFNLKVRKLKSIPERKSVFHNLSMYILIPFFILQIIVPFRYLLYPGELFWHEQGFRFSWRVMLMEKAGYTAFWVVDEENNKKIRVEPSEYLTPFQEKQMSFQPDFILEFAHFLAAEYKKKGMKDPKVYADSYVALNGRMSKQFINPNVDLAKEKISLKKIHWIAPFNDEIIGL